MAHIGLGYLSYLADKPLEALPQFNAAIRLEPNNHVGWGNLGDAHSQIPGRADEAKEAFATAIAACERKLALSPNDPETLTYLASYQAKRGERTQALQTLARLPDAQIHDLNTRFTLALTHEVLGERGVAIQEFEKLLRDHLPVAQMRAEPFLKSLVGDAAFAPILQRYPPP